MTKAVVAAAPLLLLACSSKNGAPLSSIAVTPAGQTVSSGGTQQFSATGSYSDGTTHDLTAQVSWSSSSPEVATISAGGLVTGVGPGTTTISAAVGGVTGSATLTVTGLAVTSTSLPGGRQYVAYSASMGAAGGAPPYTWSLASGALPPGLSLDAGTGAITGVPTTAATANFTARVTDARGAAAAQALSIRVATATYSLWAPSATPAVVDNSDGSALSPGVELGVKFRSDVDGFVTAVRFYKATANVGSHEGHLWSSAGQLLASASFTGETTSGWQEVSFSTPVPVSANAVYVASYHTSSGHYSADGGYFAKGVDNAPLHGLADGVSGADGVFAYGVSGTFPSNSSTSFNYWVDVVFLPATAPTSLLSIAVTPGASEVQMGATQQLAASATYSDGTVIDVSRAVDWGSADTTIATVSVAGVARAMSAGATQLAASLNGLPGSATVTVPVPAPQASEGPGGPILVVSSSGKPFSRYLAEILLAEGFDEFTAMDLANVTSATLSGYDLVVLGDVPLTAAQAQLFASWVTAGGRLVAMHPDKQLAGLLGLDAASGTLSDGYVLVDTSSAPGAGIVGQTIQFHGSADLYKLAGATKIATLYSSASDATSYPAVTLKSAGQGQAAAFAYDLARSVVYTRQGNPAWSGQPRDGLIPTRSDNLFYGPADFDPRPNWVDLTKVAIPQADEHQRLLGNLILQMSLARRPLPRFWYFPSRFKAVVVMTGDDHATGGTAGRFDTYLASSAAGCSVADWACIRSTSYIYPNAPLTSAQATTYTGQGFEVALHVSTNCLDWTSQLNLDSAYATQLSTFASKYTGIPLPSTNRTHCVAWSDYDTQPTVELAHGIRLDTTYYYYPPAWVKDQPGFMTGSGIPMRFADMTGRLIDVYQAATQMTDESGQTYPKNIDALLDGALGSTGYYGAFTANMHTDQVQSTGSDAIVASAKARGVPIVSALQMLRWLDARNGSSFGSISWAGNVLSFNVSAASAARNLTAMLPASVGSVSLATITKGGASVAFSTETVKGVAYAVFPVTTAAYQATYH